MNHFMNDIITKNNKKRYLPHDINTIKYAVEMYRNCWYIYMCAIGYTVWLYDFILLALQQKFLLFLFDSIDFIEL